MVLRKVDNVEIARRGILRNYYEIRAPSPSSRYWYRRLSKDTFKSWQHNQWFQPIAVVEGGAMTWWWYRGEFYVESDGYSAEEVELLVWDRELEKHEELERRRKESLSQSN